MKVNPEFDSTSEKIQIIFEQDAENGFTENIVARNALSQGHGNWLYGLSVQNDVSQDEIAYLATRINKVGSAPSEPVPEVEGQPKPPTGEIELAKPELIVLAAGLRQYRDKTVDDIVTLAMIPGLDAYRQSIRRVEGLMAGSMLATLCETELIPVALTQPTLETPKAVGFRN